MIMVFTIVSKSSLFMKEAFRSHSILFYCYCSLFVAINERREKADFLFQVGNLLGLVQDDSIVLLLEPLHSLLAGDLVGIAEVSTSSLSLGHTTTGAGQLDVEIHTENTGVGVVLDSEINVLVDTETEVSGVREVLLHELVLLDLEAALQNLQGLLTTDGDVHGDLLVTADGESTDGETGYSIMGRVWEKHLPFPYTGS